MNKSNLSTDNTIDKHQHGMVLITVLLVSMLLTFIGLSLADLAISQYGRTSRNVYVANSLLIAEAGIERTLNEINLDASFSGFPLEQEFFNNETQGIGRYTTAVTSGTSLNEKIITSTGSTYSDVTGDLISTRKVKVTIVGTASYEYNVLTGPGGLILGGNSSLNNTDVFVNGFLTTSGNAQIGSVNQPLNIFVANRQCPYGNNPGPTYPVVCNGGQQPVDAGGNGIFGTVCATGQTDSDGIFPGNGGQGLVVGCIADDPVSQPTYDRAAHVASMSPLSGYAANSSTYACNNATSWPANLRLNGNVDINKNNCDLTINGNVYITGNLVLRGQGKIRVADGLTTRPTIVVDGTITSTNGIALIPNDLGVGFHFISFKSSAACSPGCTSVTGTDLHNSQSAIVVDIKSNGGSPGTIMQAYWGKIYVGAGGVMGSAIGQTVELTGTGDIVFGTTLSSGTSTWTIRSYQYDFN